LESVSVVIVLVGKCGCR